MAITLIIAVTCANMLHTGYHQRIWAAKDTAAVRQGTLMAAVLTCVALPQRARLGEPVRKPPPPACKQPPLPCKSPTDLPKTHGLDVPHSRAARLPGSCSCSSSVLWAW